MAEVNPFAKYGRTTAAAEQPAETNPFAQYGRPKPETVRPQGPRSYQWSEVPGAALENLPSSAGKFAGNLAEMVTSPIETGAAIHDFGANLKNFLLASYFPNMVSPEEVAAADRTVNAMVTGLSNRYGGMEQLKRTIAEDPVGFGADISPFLKGVGSIPQAGAAGKIMRGVGTLVDPMTLPLVGAQGVGKLAGNIGTGVVNLMDPKRAALMQMAGDKAPEILNALQNAQEILPGSKPTAAEAVAPTKAALFTSFAKSAEEVAPTSEKFIDRRFEQAAARRGAVGSVAGTAEDLKKAEDLRSTEAAANYGQAFKDMTRADPALGQLARDPYVNQALKNAEELSTSQGITFKSNPIQYLHNTKTRLDTMIQAETDPVVARQLLTKQKELVDWIESKSPAYRKARETYAKTSGPINQMKVGQYLEDKLVPALMESEDTLKLREADFGRAMQDAPGTLKKSTGFARYQDLADVLTPDQVKTLENVRDDLARSQLANQLAAAGKKGGALQLKDFVQEVTKEVKGPPLVKTMVSLTNDIVKRLKGQLTDKLAVELAEAMLNPDTAAEALKRAMAADKRVKMTGNVITFAPKAAFTAAKNIPRPAVNVLGNEENRNALSEQPLITVTKGIK